ncbi:MAG: hypothetical protein H5U08_12000 [Thermogutta sp.]|uniref:hypothetical protein n=1 Tax=Thermogutta sp. TaxID=1962930 RepID=UPI0019C044EB|nr:hypothetical protein [Thermogutta sp.]MBC7353074.1 hypothetical protein [Thermogutta sp.]
MGMTKTNRVWRVVRNTVAVAALFLMGRFPERCILATESPQSKAQQNLTEVTHRPVPLLDANGRNVIASGQPVSAERTCGACHDTQYISDHCYHADLGIRRWFRPGQSERAAHAWDYTSGGVGGWKPFFYQRLSPPGESKPDLGLADWLRTYGFRYVGGRLGQFGFGNEPLTKRGKTAQEQAAAASDTAADGTQVEKSASETTASATPGSHSGLTWDPDLMSTLSGNQPVRWDWRSSGTLEMNCFVCHLHSPDNTARVEEIKAGRFAWAVTATLARTGAVIRKGTQWEYNKQAFDERGAVVAQSFRIERPTAEQCGQCHGKVVGPHEQLSCLEISWSDWSTLTKGQVFSAQRISDSELNIAGKKNLIRPWDIHAASLLDCRHCHFSLDNPALFEPPARGRPKHLRFEPRRLSFAEYLERPSHQFAKGDTAQGKIAPEFTGTMRTCRDCHDATAAHEWLPFRAVHLARLECETCHIPAVYAPALEAIDWSAPADGQPFLQWRGVTWSSSTTVPVITGFRPVILPRKAMDGEIRLGPYNLVRASYWVEAGASPRPVSLRDLEAILSRPAHNPESKSGESSPVFSTSYRRRLPPRYSTTELATQLKNVGVTSPEHVVEIWPFGIHHGVAPARLAIRQCETCHSSRSLLGQAFSLGNVQDDDNSRGARIVPGSGIPEAYRLEISWSSDNPALILTPNPEKAGFYILGKSRHNWVDWLGFLAFLGVVLTIGVHTSFRVFPSLSLLKSFRRQD